MKPEENIDIQEGAVLDDASDERGLLLLGL